MIRMPVELGPAAAAADQGLDEGSAPPSLLARLDDLRRRLMRIAGALAIGFLAAFLVVERIFDFVMHPLASVLPDGGRLIYTQTTAGFTLRLRMAALVGTVVASPAVLWQVWGLVAPVLSRRARRRAMAFVTTATLLFAAGAAFGHFVAFPWLWRFLASFTTDYVRFLPEIAPAFSLYMKVVLACGLVAQWPIVVVFLARAGVVTHRTLAAHGRYAVLAAVVVAAVVTPPDPVSLLVVAAPLVGLYGLAIVIAWLVAPRARPGA